MSHFDLRNQIFINLTSKKIFFFLLATALLRSFYLQFKILVIFNKPLMALLIENSNFHQILFFLNFYFFLYGIFHFDYLQIFNYFIINYHEEILIRLYLLMSNCMVLLLLVTTIQLILNHFFVDTKKCYYYYFIENHLNQFRDFKLILIYNHSRQHIISVYFISLKLIHFFPIIIIKIYQFIAINMMKFISYFMH